MKEVVSISSLSHILDLNNVSCFRKDVNWGRLGLGQELSVICPDAYAKLNPSNFSAACDEFVGNYKPTTGELLKYLGYWAQTPLILAFFAEVALIGLFLAEICILCKISPNAGQGSKKWTCFVLSFFPIDGMVNVIGMLSPKSAESIVPFHIMSRIWVLTAFCFYSKHLIRKCDSEISELYQRSSRKLASTPWFNSFSILRRWLTCWNSNSNYTRQQGDAEWFAAGLHMQAFPILMLCSLFEDCLERSGLWDHYDVDIKWTPARIFPIIHGITFVLALLGHAILFGTFKRFLDHFNYFAKLLAIDIAIWSGILLWIMRETLVHSGALLCVFPISSDILSRYFLFSCLQLTLPICACLAWSAFITPLQKAQQQMRDPVYTVTSGLGTPPAQNSRIRVNSIQNPLFPTAEGSD